ncbi:MAG: multiheme c-type cytochrome [Aeoliella sp.]
MTTRLNNHRVFAAAGDLLAVGIVVHLALATASAEQDSTLPASISSEASIDALASCSNSNCHGGTRGDIWEQSYTLWAARDPHADAYAVLNRSASRKMIAKLHGGAEIEDAAYRQYIDTHCAVCHATTETASATRSHRDHFSAGVTCGSCHGAAENWLDGHLRKNPPEQARATVGDADSPLWRYTNVDYGLRDLNDEITRARTCVGCHVGSAGDATTPRRNVNHDLIAAGHPRLAFEYTSHVANLPSHWDEEPIESADYQWAVGQLVAADAAVELLLARVESGVWPEFSEYNCASCHHHLLGVDNPPASLSKGTVYDWGSWYFPLAVAAAPNAVELTDDLTALRKAMSPLVPDKQQVKPAAERVRGTLQQAIANLEPTTTGESIARQFIGGLPLQIEWDVAVQAYLWHAHRQAATDSNSQELQRLFQALDPKGDRNGPLWLHNEPNRVKVHQALRALDKPEN